jgi:hypothetical protein
MEFARKLILWLSALAIALAPRAASAASPLAASNSAGKASAIVLHPLTLVRKTDMNFGNIIRTGAGTAKLEPVANTLSTTGLLTSAGGAPTAATFVGAAGSASVVIIRVPTAPVLIRRVGGTETMTVDNWTLQGQNKRTLAKQESFEFRVGATLTVAAGQVEGDYVGSFDVTVQYP